MSHSLRGLAALSLLAVTLAALPAPAQAHAILIDSAPPAGGHVTQGKVDLRFRYNSRIDQARSRLTLTKPDHSQTTIAIAPDSPPDSVLSHLNLTPGPYTVRWQVLATDGHITRGDVPFTVTGP